LNFSQSDVMHAAEPAKMLVEGYIDAVKLLLAAGGRLDPASIGG
jgi:hypothetical protein